MDESKTRGCRMAIRGPVQLLMLALVAMLGACTQHTATTTKRAPPLIVGPQAFDVQAAPQRQASITHTRRVATAPRKHSPFAARPTVVRQAALTNGAVGIASFYNFDSKTASGEQFKPG